MLAAWSGGAFATDYSQLGGYIVHGGGHGDYWGNEVYVFDLDTLLWRRLSDPYEPTPGERGWLNARQPLGPGGDKEEGEYAPGIPAASHTYDNVQYLPASFAGNREGYFLRLTGTSNGRIGGGFSGRTHAFDLDTGRWMRYSLNLTAGREGGGGGTATCFDMRRARFWAIGKGSSAVTRFLDVASRTWSSVRHAEGRAHNLGYDMTGAYHPDLDLFVVLFRPVGRGRRITEGTQLWAMSCAKPAAGWLRLHAHGPTPVRPAPGLEWCPPLGCFVAYEGAGAHRVLKLAAPRGDPLNEAWRWEEEEISGDPPVGRPGGAGHYSRFCWAPAARCFIWADRNDAPVQAWRLRGT